MSLRDELRAKLRCEQGSVGWKELVQGKPEVHNLLIDIAGTAIANGATPEPKEFLAALNLVLRKKQHVHDLDILIALGAK